jgi:hypothetical protein
VDVLYLFCRLYARLPVVSPPTYMVAVMQWAESCGRGIPAAILLDLAMTGNLLHLPQGNQATGIDWGLFTLWFFHDFDRANTYASKFLIFVKFY